MRTRLRSKVTLLFMSCALLIAIPAVAAIADTVANNLDNTIDATLEQMNLTVGGADASTKIYVEPATGDGINGCNVKNTAQITISASSGDTSVATVSPSSANIADCGEAKGAILTVHPVGTGTTTIHVTGPANVTIGSNTGTFTYQADFQVTVAPPPDSTPPQVQSLDRASATNPTNASSVSWLVTFSESVTGVDAGDFQLASNGLSGAQITGVTGSGSTRTVTASTGTGDGSLGLNLVDDDSIKDGVGNALAGPSGANGSFTGQVYTIDRTGPTVTLTDVNGSARSFPYLTNQNVSSVGGACEAGGSAVSVTRDGNATSPATATCSAQGTWTLTLSSPLATDGTYAFAATQNDAAGNSGNSGPAKSVQIDKTAPSISNVSAVKGDAPDFTGATTYTADTWTNKDVKVSWTCSDAGSGPVKASDSQTVATEGGAGSVTPSCADNAGNTATGTAFGPIKIDKTNPTISSSADRMDGTTVLGPYSQGTWTNKSVRVTFTCNDPLSGVDATASNIAGNTLTTEGEDQSVSSTGSCVDQAGNTASGASFSNIDIDKTNPTIDGSASPAANSAGWNNTNVTVSFDCADALSGVASCPADVTLSSDGADQSVTRSVSDNAGNSASDTVGNIDIDKTKPSVSVTGVSNGAIYTTGNVPTPGCNTTDGLSGVKTDATVNVTGGTGGFGTLTATCTGAVDNADNAQAAPVSVTYSVKAAFNGFLQPIDGHSVNTGKYGRTYPIKWQLRDDSGALISDATAQLLVGTMTGGQKAVSCTSFDLADADALEESTTGNTTLRYDATSDQFIYNYKAPSSGTCYVFAIRNADGLTTQQIDFKFTK